MVNIRVDASKKFAEIMASIAIFSTPIYMKCMFMMSMKLSPEFVIFMAPLSESMPLSESVLPFSANELNLRISFTLGGDKLNS